MKKVLNYILLTAVLGTFLPYSALAQTTDVGVNITGSVSIDVVTTISANITLDLTTGETTPTYMEIQNNSSVPVNAKITNISTTSEGAPSTFVGQYDKDWNHLSKEETSTYVNFNILGEGQNVERKDILADTEISGISYMELVFYEENHPVIGSEIKSSGHQLVLNLYSNLQKSERDKIASQNYAVTVNGQVLNKSVLSDYLIEDGGYLQLGADIEYGASIGIPYILNELEGTSEGKTNYLKVVVTINGDNQYSYTFIEKIIVYNK